MSVSFTWTVEAYLGGAWTDISADVLRHYSIVAAYGIDGSDITDRVATVGRFSCMLDNGESNSAGLLGYYAPDHANARSGFERGMKIRLKLASGGTTKYPFYGELEEIEPSAGQFRERTTRILAYDYVNKLLDHKLERILVQENQRPDQLIQTILDNVPTAPLNTALDTDTITFTLALHSEQDEKTTALAAINKVCKSALGYAFRAANSTDGETFTYQMRHTRSSKTVAATLSDTMSGLKVVRSGERYRNHTVITIHPVTIDEDATVCSLAQEFELAAGASYTFNLRLRDPSGAGTRISAKDFEPLVADTDYKMSSVSGDGGNNLNAYLSASIDDGGNTVAVTVENTGSVTGYINKLQVRADAILQYDPMEIEKTSDAADRRFDFDLPYQDDFYVGDDFAVYIHSVVSTEFSTVDKVWFYADANATLMSYALDVDIGDKVSLTETATGISAEYYVNHITYTIERGTLLRVAWVLTPAAAAVPFFILDDATYGKLDSGNQLAF